MIAACWLWKKDINRDDAIQDIAWMDDLAAPLQDSTAVGILNKLRRATVTTVNECLKAILLPNLKAGKTEAIATLVGRGSKKIARETFRASDPTLLFDSELWPDAKLRLTASYKHLGGIVQVEGGIQIQDWCCMASFRKHRKATFASPIVAAAGKQILFSTLVESTQYFGTGAWPRASATDIRKLQHAVVAMSRQSLAPSVPLRRHATLEQSTCCLRLEPCLPSLRFT